MAVSREELARERAEGIARAAVPALFERPRRGMTRAARRAWTRRRIRVLADARQVAERELAAERRQTDGK